MWGEFCDTYSPNVEEPRHYCEMCKKEFDSAEPLKAIDTGFRSEDGWSYSYGKVNMCKECLSSYVKELYWTKLKLENEIYNIKHKSSLSGR